MFQLARGCSIVVSQDNVGSYWTGLLLFLQDDLFLLASATDSRNPDL